MVGKNHLLGLGVALFLAAFGVTNSASAAGKVFFEEGTARWGSTYMTVPATHPNTCQNECTKDKKCMSWTFVHPTGRNKGECQLKNMVPHRAFNACCTSGVLIGAGAPRGDVDRAWSDANRVSSNRAPVEPAVSLTPAAAVQAAPVEPVTPADLDVSEDLVKDAEEAVSEPAPEPPVQLVPASYKK